MKSDTTVETAALSHAQISTAFFRFIKPRRLLRLPYNLPFDRLLLNNADTSQGIMLGKNMKLNMTIKGVWSNCFMSGKIGSQSYECQYLAGVLNDPELQDIASAMLRWQLGENPFNTNMMAGLGRDFKRDIFSAALGYIPGMMTNGEFKNGKIPSLPLYRHYHHSEIYTQTQGPYQAGLLIQNSPTLLTGKLLSKPADQLQLQHIKTGIIKKLEFNENLRLTPTQLQTTGTWSVLSGDKVLTELQAVSGQKINLQLNPNGNCKLKQLILPDTIEAGQVLTCKLVLYNYSNQKQTIQIKSQATNLQTKDSFDYVVTPGKNILEIKCATSENPGQVFALVVYDANNRNNHCLYSGIISDISTQIID